MASINGNWFHSRSSSNLDELLTVRILVFESQKVEYVGFGWSGDRRGNQKMYDFAGAANIQPSTMQTKIRAMIRYGFIKDSNQCPLIWTRMGSLWNDLYIVGNYEAAKKIYELTLSISLAIYAFNNSPAQYSINPANGEMPLKFLLNSLDNNNSISLRDFKTFVDGQTTRVGDNMSYWKTDLLNSGLFIENNDRLIYTDEYSQFINEIKIFNPNTLLIEDDWQAIRDNPLIDISPFKASIGEIFGSIIQQQNIAEQTTSDILTAPLVDAVAEQEEAVLPEIDILSNNTRFAHSSRRIRNTTWSIRIKKKYNYICIVPNCDVVGKLFMDAAHIKPDAIADGHIPHRFHMLNGLCLCKHCHIAFDKGYFSLADDYKILISPKFSDIVDQNLKRAILSSSNNIIKNRNDNRFPLVEFIQYHRENKFKR